jgi:predicted NBD/HSP70 family sugar kinase
MRVLALDIGGTWLRADVDGRTVQARTPENGRDALAATFELVGDIAVDAVGVSFGGRVDGDEVVSLHVPGWEDAGLAAALRDRYGAP